MASINIPTTINAPDEITINLIREDFLDTSHTFRIFFEICLAITGGIFGCIISSLNGSTKIEMVTWVFFVVMTIGTTAFLVLTTKSYKKAKTTGIKSTH